MCLASISWLFSKRFGVCLGLLMVLSFNSVAFGVHAADLTGLDAKDLSVSDYDSKHLSLRIRVHVGHLFTEHERHGFFRIGVLPNLVAEDVQMHIASAGWMGGISPTINSWRPSPAVRRVELRRLQIFLPDESHACLSAAVARPEPNGNLSLSSVSLNDTSGHSLFLARAELLISGPQAGRLRWTENGGCDQIIRFPLNPKHSP